MIYLKNLKKVFFYILISCLIISLMGCNKKNSQEVVVYTSVDRIYSEPLFEAFYEETGIKVLAVYDVEASKTTGLVQRLIQEKNHAKADVFWNGEMVQMLRLKEAKILTPYISSSAENFSKDFVDTDYEWTAFGGRARILLVNNTLPEDLWPNSWLDISEDALNMDVGIAKPMFGTSATHVAGLYTLYGNEMVKLVYKNMLESGVRVLDGNGAVRDRVVSGSLSYGMTDTDDALSAIRNGADVSIIFPDQLENEVGVMIIPNSVGLINGGPHLDNGQLFIDYLLKSTTIESLMTMGWLQLMVADEIKVDDELQPFMPDSGNIKVMNIDYDEVIKAFESSQKDMIEMFLD